MRSRKPGVDEDDAVLGGADALFQIDGGAALLVHDAHLQGQRRQVECLFDGGEQRRGDGHFFRSVHLRLHDIDRAGPAVAALRRAGQIMLHDERGDDRVENAFRHRVAIRIQHGAAFQDIADIADQHGAAAGQTRSDPSGAV